jgi:flagellar protein FlbD
MIRLTRINHKPFVLNSDLIEHIEVTPDTVITLTTGQKMVVEEPAEEVVTRVVEFRKSIGLAWLHSLPRLQDPSSNQPPEMEAERD